MGNCPICSTHSVKQNFWSRLVNGKWKELQTMCPFLVKINKNWRLALGAISSGYSFQDTVLGRHNINIYHYKASTSWVLPKRASVYNFFGKSGCGSKNEFTIFT